MDYSQRQADQDFPEFDVRLFVAPRRDIFAMLEEAWRPESGQLTATELFENMLRDAIAERASDLHLEPRDNALDVRRRIDGRLVHARFIAEATREQAIQAAKIAGRMDISERRLPQDGQGSLQIGSRHYNLRFSCLPAVNGESVVVRIIDCLLYTSPGCDGPLQRQSEHPLHADWSRHGERLAAFSHRVIDRLSRPIGNSTAAQSVESPGSGESRPVQ